MAGGTSAMFTRALRADARLVRPHLFRLLFGLLILGVLIEAHVESLTVGAPGLKFFREIGRLNVILITLAGMSYLATAITEEKEERTLGLLTLAGIGPLSLLLGKSTTRVLGTLLLLVVQFPFALLAILLGGVTLRQIVAGYVALAAYLLFTANVALLASVWCRRSGAASAVTLLVIMLSLAGTIPGRALLAGYAAWAEVPVESLQAGNQRIAAFDRLSVWTRIETISRWSFTGPILSHQVLVHLGAAVVLFFVAWALFGVRTRDDLAGEVRRGPLWRGGGRRWLAAVDRPWRVPNAWKDFHFIAGGRARLVGMFTFYGTGFGVLAWFFVDPRFEMSVADLAAAIMTVTLAGGAVELAIAAASTFHIELQEGTLAVTMLAPRPPSRVAAEKLAGGLLVLLPAAFWFWVAAAIDPHVLGLLVGEPATWFAIMLYGVFLHLTVLLSLYVRWGALPLAMAMMVVIGGCLFPLLFIPVALVAMVADDVEVGLLPIVYASGLLFAALGVMISRRLRVVAGR